ncbi:senescence-specific cysteine protease SAG39-like [Triticum aestivum]|uniref:Vignain n=1 Tax=Aegilops tauschii TaxID=37682 RepID=M8AJ99_AEGTA|nr:senescence-specific cysteine protease SAG39-like [Triticum aestivum]
MRSSSQQRLTRGTKRAWRGFLLDSCMRTLLLGVFYRAATECIVKLKTGKLISLSEQELVDCDVHGEDQGCEGRLMDDAFNFIIKNGGLTTESNYPYTSEYDKCNSGTNGAATIQSYEDVPANNEGALMQVVASQHVSVALDGGDMTFQFYKGRVMTGSCGTDLDHGIAAIGYGKTNNYTKYWLLKNSRGTTWGENGYLRTEKDIPDKIGMCGLRWSLLTPLHRRASSGTYVRMHMIN